jgi:flagellar basal-body rod modification protein FlgD
MSISSVAPGSVTAASAVTTTKNDEASADRFLKLLVAQMQNQDPLSPMDNAQVTSQMAQINTVSGIEKLNTSVQGLSGQFMQMQALQGATLVGHDVVVPGDILAVGSGLAQGGFELDSAADNVTVEVLAPSGQVLDTIDLGAQTSGLHSFAWPAGKADDSSGLRFRVTAKSGATKLSATPLMRDRIDAVSTSGNALTLELQKSGSVPYSTVKAFS